MKRILRFVSICASGVLIGGTLSSCILIAKTNEATPGRKLYDLKTALDKGAITKSEYQTQKSLILEHP